MDDKNINLSAGEIEALKKLILYVKFSCEESESILYSGSRSINSFFNKLIEASDHGTYERSFFKKRNLINEDFVKNKIIKSEVEDNRKLTEDKFEELFEQCIYPFIHYEVKDK